MFCGSYCGAYVCRRSVYFGLNRWGQCGVNQKNVDGGKNAQGIHVFDPTLVELPTKVKDVDAGLQHCVALTENGEVWVWGKGNRGQLGNGDVESGSAPTRVRLLKNADSDDHPEQRVEGHAGECRIQTHSSADGGWQSAHLGQGHVDRI